jgi:hypothetical protein
MPGKRGRLSKQDLAFIRSHAGEYEDEWIAKKLNRTVEKIKEIREAQGISDNGEEDERLVIKAALRKKPFFSDLKLQFDESELQDFEYEWTSLVLQFKNDYTYTEESQMIDLISFNILMRRLLRDKQGTIKQKDRIEKALNAELKKANADIDKDYISSLQLQLSNIIQSQQSITKEFAALQDKKQKLYNDLKGTRDKRFDKITDNKRTFQDWLKSIYQAENREREGKEAAIMKGALELELARLAKPHRYMDGVEDRPILTPDTVGGQYDSTE